MPEFNSGTGRAAVQKRWARDRAARLEDRIRKLVDEAPPLTEEQRARLAALLALPAPRSHRDRSAGAA